MPNLFPTENITATPGLPEAASTKPVKFGKSWKFDFEKGDFVLTPTGKVAETDEMEAWVDWCYKALITARYRYPIYSRNYGSELEELVGKGYPRSVIESEIRRMVIEALMVDPRTAEVRNFSFNWLDDGVEFTCEVVSVRGKSATLSLQVVAG